MNYRRALWFAKMVGHWSLALGAVGCAICACAGLFLLSQIGVIGAGHALTPALLSFLLAAVYLLLGGLLYALCAALHHYLFQALGAPDDESPDPAPRPSERRRP